MLSLMLCVCVPVYVCVQEVAAYESALARLQAEGVQLMEEAEFQQQLAAAQEELRRER